MALQLTQLAELGYCKSHRGKKSKRIAGTRARRPGLDDFLVRDAHRGRSQVVLVWASDRIARSVRHFLEVLGERNHLGVEFVVSRENLDTGGPLGRVVVTIIGAIAELERNFIIERARAGPVSKAGTSDASPSTSIVPPCSATGSGSKPRLDRQESPLNLRTRNQPRSCPKDVVMGNLGSRKVGRGGPREVKALL